MNDSYYLYSSGNLKQKDKTIEFTSIDGEKRSLPIENVKDIYVMSEMQMTTKLLELFGKYGINVHFFNYYQYYVGSFCPKENMLSGQLLVKQVGAYSDYEQRMLIAQSIVKAAAKNIYRNLRYYNSRGKNCDSAMKEIQSLYKKIDSTKIVQELMGIEGNIRKNYYSCWNVIIDQNVDFKKRVYYPPDNMINSLISFINSLVYTKTLSEIYKTQLNPTISYLHEPGTRRFSLALDISEVFKPLIADRLIFSLLNRNQITEDSFSDSLNGLRLTPKASKTIVQAFDEKMKTTIKHKELNKDVSYQFLIRLELYKLIKHLIGEKEYTGFEIWW